MVEVAGMMFKGEPIIFAKLPLLPWIGFFGVLIFGVYFFQYTLFSRWIKLVENSFYRNKFLCGASAVKRISRMVTFVVAIIFLGLVLVRPQWGKKETSMLQEGRNVVVILDISRSMQGGDVLPTRLDFAKLKIKMMLSQLNCERMGLILFSGTAFIQSPLTVDYDAFISYLDQVDTEIIASGTTAIDKALLKSVDLFKSNADDSTKLILLVTDGEDFSSRLDEVSSKLKDLNIKLVALGVGSQEGAPIPCKDRVGRIVGYEKDAQGEMALSRLNIEHLAKVAEKLSGFCVQATDTDDDIDSIVKYIHGLEKKRFHDRKFSLNEERYSIAAAIFAFFYAINALI